MTDSGHPWFLAVEDSDDDAALLVRAFAKSGLPKPVVVADGPAALALLHGQGADAAASSRPLPAVVLLDLKLPGMDGVEVLRRIRADQRTRFLPVAMLSTSTQPSEIARAYAAGACSYFRKPVEYDVFVSLIAAAGTYWTMNTAPPGA